MDLLLIYHLMISLFISWLVCLCLKRGKTVAKPQQQAPEATRPAQSAPLPSSGVSESVTSKAAGNNNNKNSNQTQNQNPNGQQQQQQKVPPPPPKVQFVTENDPRGDSLYNIKTEAAFPPKQKQ